MPVLKRMQMPPWADNRKPANPKVSISWLRWQGVLIGICPVDGQRQNKSDRSLPHLVDTGFA